MEDSDLREFQVRFFVTFVAKGYKTQNELQCHALYGVVRPLKHFTVPNCCHPQLQMKKGKH